jgi:hypothetical protein
MAALVITQRAPLLANGSCSVIPLIMQSCWMQTHLPPSILTGLLAPLSDVSVWMAKEKPSHHNSFGVACGHKHRRERERAPKLDVACQS